MKLLPALALVALLTATLTACGDDEDDTAEARTTACRTFQLAAAGEGALAVQQMRTAEADGEWDGEQLTAPVLRVAAAASTAGAVEDLADDDFEAFLNVATTARRANDAINPTGDPEVGIGDAAAELETALAALTPVCG